MKRVYGWKRSPTDERDYKLSLAEHPADAALPEVDPRKESLMPVVWDQGQLGSCTANAVAAALQYNHGVIHSRKARRPSRLDIYYGERQLEGSLGQGDTGAYGRDGFKYAQKTGYLLEKEWPYDTSRYEDQPQGSVRVKLEQSYVSVPQVPATIKAVLSNRQTVAFGFTVYESFESGAVAESGIVPMPGNNESTLGGHEVLAVGYLAAHPDYVLCRNSWGADWGLGGYFLFPWDYLCDSDLCSDLRTIARS